MCQADLSSATSNPTIWRGLRLTIVINSSGNYRHLDQPFGGYKMSGVGREGVSVTLSEMTQEKSYILKNVLT
jgi:acyl-CoA reductase-like NAD-dependent aldehyde dehydrogenase